MQAATITMDPEVAKAKLKAYRAAKHKDSEEQYRQAETAYAMLAKGTPLLQLTPSIQRGGFFPNGLPKLAIARADRKEVQFRWSWRDNLADFDCRANSRESNSLRIRVDMGRQTESYVRGFALVPMVPADVRPAVGMLRDWFVLWEVEKWFDRPQSMTAPVDPLLLKHIGGDLYAVLAQWDLTPIEQAILEGAMR